MVTCADPWAHDDAPRAEVRVLLADDQPPSRRALRAVIDATDGFAVVGEVASGEEAVEAVAVLSPHMVVMDRRMPGMGGLEATRELTARHRDIVVVLTSVEAVAPEVVASCGAASFIYKHDLSSRGLRDVWRASRSSPARLRSSDRDSR
jgi:DNA-binding NarL/FixJ family response regulator